MQTKHIKSLARKVAHILILFENWHAGSKRLPTPALFSVELLYFPVNKPRSILSLKVRVFCLLLYCLSANKLTPKNHVQN